MCDLTFSSVAPFTPIFYMNAAVQTLKCFVRDCNGIRLIVSSFMLPEHRDRQRGAYPGRRSARQSAAAGSAPSCSLALYRIYLRSFDLVLTRHQTFLSESCAKSCIITVIAMQYFLPQLGHEPSWQPFGFDLSDEEKLMLIAGQAFLWLLQLITHVVVLNLLNLQTRPGVPKAADRILAMRPQSTGADPSLRPPPSLSGQQDAAADCQCGSCSLSCSRYLRRMQSQEQRQSDAVEDAASAHSSGGLCGSLRSCASSVVQPTPAGTLHPCIQYWAVHRWFFVIQMLHWIWLVLVEQDFNFVHGHCQPT